MAIMVVTWWIVAFLPSVCVHVFPSEFCEAYFSVVVLCTMRSEE